MDMRGYAAWDLTQGDPDVLVLIIDTGVEQDHPDISQVPGMDFTTDGGDGGPVNMCDDHGTAVAGCVSATIDNSLGISGIAPGCRVLSARTFISTLDCSGSWNADYAWTVDALAWGETQGARVSNNSNYYGGSSSAITATYASTRDNGMVHFASAGNDNDPFVSYPASLPTVQAIAALNRNGNKASFSNYGSQLAFSAPGEDIYSTDRTGSDGYYSGDYGYVDGTSFASPYSAGVAALVISQEPGLTAEEVEDRLKCTCRDLGTFGFDDTFGYGFVDAHAALLAESGDPDLDGINNPCDNCPDLANVSQIDADLDLVGDDCDNCPGLANTPQEDGDSDGVGDACEAGQPGVNADDLMLPPNTPFTWDINVTNEVLVQEIVIPVNVTDVIALAFLDSLSFIGTRTEYFEDHALVFDNRFAGQIAYRLRADDGLGSPPLAGGTGPIARVFMRLRNTATPGNIITMTLNQVGSWPLSVKGPTLTFTPTIDGATLTVVSPCDCPYHSDIDNSDAIDAVDLAMLIDIVFFGSPDIQDPACPAVRSDFNCDGGADAVDLAELIDHVFFGGAGPCAPCACATYPVDCP